jgi:hypothetical protein
MHAITRASPANRYARKVEYPPLFHAPTPAGTTPASAEALLKRAARAAAAGQPYCDGRMGGELVFNAATCCGGFEQAAAADFGQAQAECFAHTRAALTPLWARLGGIFKRCVGDSAVCGGLRGELRKCSALVRAGAGSGSGGRFGRSGYARVCEGMVQPVLAAARAAALAAGQLLAAAHADARRGSSSGSQPASSLAATATADAAGAAHGVAGGGRVGGGPQAGVTPLAAALLRACGGGAPPFKCTEWLATELLRGLEPPANRTHAGAGAGTPSTTTSKVRFVH